MCPGVSGGRLRSRYAKTHSRGTGPQVKTRDLRGVQSSDPPTCLDSRLECSIVNPVPLSRDQAERMQRMRMQTRARTEEQRKKSDGERHNSEEGRRMRIFQIANVGE